MHVKFVVTLSAIFVHHWLFHLLRELRRSCDARIAVLCQVAMVISRMNAYVNEHPLHVGSLTNPNTARLRIEFWEMEIRT